MDPQNRNAHVVSLWLATHPNWTTRQKERAFCRPAQLRLSAHRFILFVVSLTLSSLRDRTPSLR